MFCANSVLCSSLNTIGSSGLHNCSFFSENMEFTTCPQCPTPSILKFQTKYKNLVYSFVRRLHVYINAILLASPASMTLGHVGSTSP